MGGRCKYCMGKGCKRCFLLSKIKLDFPKPSLHFSGRSAPDVFVGRIGYPKVNAGILAPSENDSVSKFSSASEWEKNNFSIANILRVRSQLVYGRAKMDVRLGGRLKKVTEELAMSSRPVLTEIFLKKKPAVKNDFDSVVPPVMNPAPIERAVLEENPKIEKKVDYLSSDTSLRASDAIGELYSCGVEIERLQKMLSVGIFGRARSRKMVPTRWAITAADDEISKRMISRIRDFSSIEDFFVFRANFVGNFIWVVLCPGNFCFEAIEAWIGEDDFKIMSDHEDFFGRKTYADIVAGGYYAMRLASAEYLNKIRKRAAVFVFREIRPEYYSPLGVGIVRECSRRAMKDRPLKFESLRECLDFLKKESVVDFSKIEEASWFCKNYGKQKNLADYFS